jgi:hypothetical protein
VASGRGGEDRGFRERRAIDLVPGQLWQQLPAAFALACFGREGLVSSITVRLESAAKLDAFKATVSTDNPIDPLRG